MVRPLLVQLQQMVQQLLQYPDLPKIEKVEVFGGTTRIPCVQEVLQTTLGCSLSHTLRCLARIVYVRLGPLHCHRSFVFGHSGPPFGSAENNCSIAVFCRPTAVGNCSTAVGDNKRAAACIVPPPPFFFHLGAPRVCFFSPYFFFSFFYQFCLLLSSIVSVF